MMRFLLNAGIPEDPWLLVVSACMQLYCVVYVTMFCLCPLSCSVAVQVEPL